MFEINFSSADIIFWNQDEVPYSSYGGHEFWIDEFSISKTQRVVVQTAYPQVAFVTMIMNVLHVIMNIT